MMTVYYVLSSHWDREWYQAFQDYRFRLVKLMDEVLRALKSNELKGPFCTDGQSILAEDYLEIRPEKRGEFDELVRAGKIRLGPCYVQPDEFLVSGESLIRNLRWGRRMARAYGGTPSDVGMICDQFGHISQLPQIFKGFGICSGMLWRGVYMPDERHFIWSGADGTELLCYRWGGEGYGDFAIRVRGAFEPGARHNEKEQQKGLDEYIAREAACTKVRPVLLYDGGDHLEYDPHLYRSIRTKIESGEVAHVDLDRYMDAVRQDRSRVTEWRTGELRDTGREKDGCVDTTELITGILSSRVWMKQRNGNCETLLTRWAEPFSLFATEATGAEYPQDFLNVAWKWLLQNHPHDSICGCSIDRVHEDMKFRFSQCEQIGDRLSLEAFRHIGGSIKEHIGKGKLRITVFNPDAQPFCGTTEMKLLIPEDWPSFSERFGYENQPAFRIYGPNGKEIAYQRVAQKPGRINTRISAMHFPEKCKSTEVTISLPVEIPACGYVALSVCPGDITQGNSRAKPTRHTEQPPLAVSANAMQNKKLRVEIQSNGTLRLIDRRSGQVYENLMAVEDTADIGDGWYHGRTVNDQTWISMACAADFALVHNGPFLATFRLRARMRVPVAFDFKGWRRMEDRVEMEVDSLISLRPESESVEVRTRIINPAKDHRVRMLFPSGCCAADTYWADSSFDVVERKIALDKDRHLFKEMEVETKPHQTWVAVGSDGRGLAVISKGLYESAIRDTEDRAVALTLFRSTGRTVLTSGEPGGQLLNEEMTFDYRIRPLQGIPDVTALCRDGQRIAAGLRHVHHHARDVDQEVEGRRLPAVAGFVQVEGDVIVTSMQRTEKGAEFRLFNPTADVSSVRMIFGEQWVPGRVERVDFESVNMDAATPINNGCYAFDLQPKEIRTLCFY